MSSGYKLLCLGNPLLDIQAKGDEAMLQKYGLKANDAILAEEKHMGLYDELASKDAKFIPGGAAQNAARGAQYILPPSSVLYIGCVGADPTADTLRSANAAAGLATAYLVDGSQPTGRCGVIITGGDRSLCTHLAAANEYRLAHLASPAIWAHAAAARVFYVGGYHLTVCVPAILALGREAATADKTFAINLSAPFIPQLFQHALDQVLPYADVVIGNETEAEAYATAHGMSDGKDLKAVATAMANVRKENAARKRIVVVTQGTETTLVAVQGEEGVREFGVREVPKGEICDTNGAGDAFAGGFMAGIVQGEGVERCVDLGHWLASLGVRELGPSYPYPPQKYQPTSTS